MEISKFLNSEHGRIVIMVLILLASVLAGWLIKKAMYFFYVKRSAKRKIEPGTFLLITSFIRLTILVIGVSYAISIEPGIKSVTTSLLASAGIATAIIGFAAKDVLANFVSGTVIIIFRPFTVTHWIKVGNIHEGRVEKITLLYTVINDITNRRLIIPNSKILGSDVVNSSYHQESVCQLVKFKVGYDADIEKAKGVIQKVAEESPLSLDIRTKAQIENNEAKVEVRLFEFETFAIQLVAFVWVRNQKDAIKVNWALNEEVKTQLNEVGIELHHPHFALGGK